MTYRIFPLACLTWLSAIICGCSTVSSLFNKDQNKVPVVYETPHQAYVNLIFDSGQIEFKSSGESVSVRESVNFVISTNMNIKNINIEEAKSLMDKDNMVVHSVSRMISPNSNNVNSTYVFNVNNKEALCIGNYLMTEYLVFKEKKLSVRSNLRQPYCQK